MNAAPIVWIDCEMTGLDLDRDALVEIACVVTGPDLEPLDDGIDVVIHTSEDSLAQMSDVVRTMHTESGLLPLISDGVELAAAEEEILDYVRGHVPEPRKAPLGGSSVHVDRMFLARDMPQLLDHLHYRIVDVSSIKELTRRWYPRTYYNSPEKRGGHRALADILDSIKELRYYQQTVFVAQPGPSADDARRHAHSVQPVDEPAPQPPPLSPDTDAN